MKITTQWTEKMQFVAEADAHRVTMDTKSPIGSDTALSPKQLLLAAVCGCTGMDVVALLKKYKQPLETFSVEAEADLTTGIHPAIFTEIRLTFKATGAIESSQIVEAVKLSQTKFCGVSAMVAKAVPITYSIEVNGASVGVGRAEFP